jgi:hypothetical protein
MLTAFHVSHRRHVPFANVCIKVHPRKIIISIASREHYPSYKRAKAEEQELGGVSLAVVVLVMVMVIIASIGDDCNGTNYSRQEPSYCFQYLLYPMSVTDDVSQLSMFALKVSALRNTESHKHTKPKIQENGKPGGDTQRHTHKKRESGPGGGCVDNSGGEIGSGGKLDNGMCSV